jgi:dihydrofolate reductase
MSKLIYVTNTSLDGYIEDATGNFDWPSSDQLFGFFSELLRPIGTLLYGRRLYEKMAYWGAPVEGYAPEHRAFAQVWQRLAKIVFSRTLSTPMTHKHADLARSRRRGDSRAQIGVVARHDRWRRRACVGCARSQSR